MMGLTHRMTGLAAGACVSALARPYVVPAPAPAWACVLVCACAFLVTWLAGKAALWPDLDHHNSTATNSMGIISGFIHEFVHVMSCRVYDMSATDRDMAAGDFRGHRGLSHFAITALVVGAALGLGAALLATHRPVVAVAVAAAVVVALVASVLFSEPTAAGLGLLVFAGVWWVLGNTATPAATTWLSLVGPTVGVTVGLATMLGMLAHSIGDAATKTGVPLLWPIRIRGQRYYPIHIRSVGNRLTTGTSAWAEMKLRFVCWVLLVPAAVGWWPGAYGALWSLLPNTPAVG